LPVTSATRKSDLSAPALPLWVRALGTLPWGAAYALAAALAWFARVVLRVRVRVARENLEGCFPDWLPGHVEETLARHYRGLSEVLVEFIKQGRMSAQEINERMPFVDAEPVRAALAAGRPVMILTAHCGNWEWALQRLQLEFGVPLVGAYKPPRSAAADRAMSALRGRFGVRMVAAKRLLRELARLRRVAHIAAFVADQVPTTSPNRQWLTFLGRATAFFPGPTEIARIGSYEVYYIAITRTARGRYAVHFQPVAAAGEALEPLEFTRRYAARVEAQVRAAPADWMWVHRRWKLEPPAGGNDSE
jgi:KDO2-lipid IV(A) lauroyltransferase